MTFLTVVTVIVLCAAALVFLGALVGKSVTTLG